MIGPRELKRFSVAIVTPTPLHRPAFSFLSRLASFSERGFTFYRTTIYHKSYLRVLLGSHTSGFTAAALEGAVQLIMT